MLKREQRLVRQKDFDRVFSQGKSYQNDCLVLRFFPNGLETARFAAVISSRTEKKAAGRNLLRRQISEVIRDLERQKKLSLAVDAVVIAKPALPGRSFKEIKESLASLLKKADLLIQ